jgi:hypothetical protein
MLPACLLAAACNDPVREPQTSGARNAGYTYIALDPLPVAIGPYTKCRPRTAGAQPDVLDALPDIASRVATRSLSGEANFSAGPAAVGVKGKEYEVVVDFAATDTANLTFQLPAAATGGGDATAEQAEGVKRIDPPAAAADKGKRSAAQAAAAPAAVRTPAGQEKVVIPVYVGVGLRLRARVEVLEGKVNLANLAGLAAGVQGDRVAGSLTVQTLGINGPKVSLLVAAPNELNPTTVQNATLSLGSIRALLYAADTQPKARVTGIYYPFPKADPEIINAIVSELAKTPIPWEPCRTG